jgi:glycosyltransferase involved in cell wall biosynthesis
MPATLGLPLSVVVPVYDEAANVAVFLNRTLPLLASLNRDFELLFVDDGSRDNTAAQLTAAAGACPSVRLLRLSRNFGHQAALVAGLAHARGAAVITMDGDLQHPPELIPQLVAAWDQGVDVVQAVRREPADTNALKRAGSRAFYRLLSNVSRLAVTPGASDFRLMSRAAVDAFLACPERCRFNRGLVQWIGFTRREILYDAAPRHAGRSKYSWAAMLRLAGDAVFSFSSLPLRLAGLAGACVSVVATLYLLFVLGAYFFTERTVPGWASTLAAVLVLGGVNLVVMWILGEYVGRLYEEVKQRPIYIVRSEITSDEPSHPVQEARTTGRRGRHAEAASRSGANDP